MVSVCADPTIWPAAFTGWPTRADRARREEQRAEKSGPGELQLDEPRWHGWSRVRSTTTEKGAESEVLTTRHPLPGAGRRRASGAQPPLPALSGRASAW